MNATEQQLVKLIGKHYQDVFEQLNAMDWENIYPVVDIDGKITGEIFYADSEDYNYLGRYAIIHDYAAAISINQVEFNDKEKYWHSELPTFDIEGLNPHK